MPIASRATSRLLEQAGALALALVLGATSCRGGEWNLGENRDDDVGRGGQAGAPSSGEHPLLERVLALGRVELVDGIQDPEAKQDDATSSLDGLELYFCANREGGLGREDVWVARRARVDEPFGAPELVEAASSSARETAAAISPDALTLWFASDRQGEGDDLDLWRVTRATREQEFGEAVHLIEVSGPTDELPRSPSRDYPFLPFVVESEETGYDLFELPWDGVTLGSPRPLPGVTTEHAESDPTFSPDGLLLIFASDQDEPNGDLYVATRASRDEPFGEPRPLDALNSSEEESDPWLAPDGDYLLFTSQRDGRRAIYRASAP